jgi:WD40 repeat protein
LKAKQRIQLKAAVVKIKSAKDSVIAITEDKNINVLNGSTLKSESVFKAEGADFFRYTNSFDISYDGRYLAFAIKGTTKYQIWDIALKKMVLEVLHLHTAEVYSLRFSPHEQKLASGGMDGKSFVFDFTSKKVTPTYGIRSDFISAFAWNPNKKHIAIAGYDKEIRIHNIADTENHISMTGLEEPIVRMEFLDDRELAVFYRDGQILIFDTFTQKIVANPKKLNDGVSAFAMLDGYMYTSGRERNIKLLSAKNYEELSESFIKNQTVVSAMDVFGKKGLIVGCLDGSISLYELDSDNKELENLIMSGNFGEAYALVEDNPFLRQDENFSILEEAWQMSLQDIIYNVEDGKMDAAKKMAQSYMQIGEKRLVLQTLFKQFDEFPKLKYALERSNFELAKSIFQKNNYFKMTKLYEKFKNKL